MKKILVFVKRVPDYEAKIKPLADGSGIETAGIKWILNPFDEIAVEEAIRLKESQADVEVVLISVGPGEATEQLRTGLAMGADRAILVKTDQDLDSASVAKVAQVFIERETPWLVLLGKQAIDSDAHQTGQYLAELVDYPQATCASEVSIVDDSEALVSREVDGGIEILRVKLPAVITSDLRLNEPRYPSLPNIVKAKKKALEEIDLETLGVQLASPVRILKLEVPPERGAGQKVSSVEELVDKLVNEAKVFDN